MNIKKIKLLEHETMGFEVVWTCSFYMSHITRKPVFRVCDQVRHKQVCAATEAR